MMTFAEAEQYLATTFHPLLVVHSSYSWYLEADSKPAVFAFVVRLPDCCLRERKPVQDPHSEGLQDGQSFGSLKVQNPFAGF